MSDDAIQCIKCTFRGCRARTFQPYTDGWANLSAWGPGIPDGWYCGPHADAIERVRGFDDPQDQRRSV
jgi:hypothetical protein